ncbi:AAA family ATPase [Microbacterium album]|uniref:Orc1-like AAA ATPase domain-containing protein n=1 Tax=Microbacterium album TaxID=2053191 RepID=A0A917IE52_9MICO|nr:ATP-binding protein [Microbacterium album]GGH44061.1 hypothetical protein GCM10010921_18460 [Microbacterium album]
MPFVSSGVFVGREAEVARVTDALHGALTPDLPTSACIVVGEGGFGKSALLDATISRLTAALPHAVLWAAGDPAETNLDYGVADQLMRSARPVAARTPRFARDAEPIELGAQLLRLADEVGRAQRLLFVIDDAHAADEPSLQALAFATRRLKADQAALLIATRPAGVRRLPQALMRLSEDRLVTLAPFTEHDVGELVRAVHGAEVEPQAAQRVFRHTRGHPLLTRVLLDALTASDLRDDESPLPSSLDQLAVDRLVRCSARARRLLEALAVLAAPSPVGVAAGLAGIQDPMPAVTELGDAGLVDVERSPSGTTLIIRHRLIQEALYAALPPDDRIALHAGAAGVTAGTAALGHRVAATTGEDPGLIDALTAQAEADERRGARRAAAELLFTAADLPGAPHRHELILRAADHLVSAGKIADARLNVLAALPDSALRSSVLGRAKMAEGSFDEARGLLQQA